MKMTKEDIKKMASHLYKGEYDDVQNWFEFYGISPTKNPARKKEIINFIFNASYFFSFRSPSFNIQELNRQRKERHFAILKHFSFSDQINILGKIAFDDDIISKEYVDKLNITKPKEIKEDVKKFDFSYILIKAFNLENFELLDALEEKLKIDVMQLPYSTTVFFYKEKSARGGFTIKAQEPIFTAKNEIIFNYSDAKKEYLESKNLKIADHIEAQNYLSVCENLIEKDQYLVNLGYKEKVQLQVDIYLKHAMRHYLSEKLIENNKEIKVNKI